MLFPPIKTSTGIIAYLVGIASAFAVAGALFRLLEPLRRGGIIARFTARFWIIGSFYFTFAAAMAIIAGPYIFAGPTRYGGYNSDPITFRETLIFGIGLGIFGAFMWPFVSAAKGYKSDM